MKKLAGSVLLLLCILSVTVSAQARKLVPVGQVIGLELSDDTVTVASFDEELGARARAAGLRAGDCIVKIDDTKITRAEDVRRALDRARGTVQVTVRRGEKTQTLKLTPQITAEGPKLGVLLKQGITGVGTVTWYDPETGKFGTLGHGVSGTNGALADMVSGNAYKARVASVKRGEAGKPGLLRGSVEGGQILGSLEKNTDRGVFGQALAAWQGVPLEVAENEEVKTGPATIRSTVEGDTVREYSVEILKIYPRAKAAGRNLLIKVTDPALLEATGGIVQGMSGSPILQDGKLIGAVTHVLVNDPTTGYGIFIENMLDAAA